MPDAINGFPIKNSCKLKLQKDQSKQVTLG